MDTISRALITMAAVFTMAWVVLWAVSQDAAAADSGTCYTIGDADARNYCLAKAHGEASMCYAVQRGDLRAQCLAEVRK